MNLEAVYPNPEDLTEEYSFEELRARQRGWLDRTWHSERVEQSRQENASLMTSNEPISNIVDESQEEVNVDIGGDQTLSESTLGGSLKPREKKGGRSKKKKFVEVKGETQTGKAFSYKLEHAF